MTNLVTADQPWLDQRYETVRLHSFYKLTLMSNNRYKHFSLSTEAAAPCVYLIGVLSGNPLTYLLTYLLDK